MTLHRQELSSPVVLGGTPTGILLAEAVPDRDSEGKFPDPLMFPAVTINTPLESKNCPQEGASTVAHEADPSPSPPCTGP